MAELTDSSASANGSKDLQSEGRPSVDRRASVASISVSELESETEKERTVAKAALSIAELSEHTLDVILSTY
jgi:hypothetical protein